MPYKNELIPGMFIILFLGEIEPNDLTKAFIQEYYVLGMTMEMEYADTYYATPLGFILHDIQHRNNRLVDLEKYLENNIDRKNMKQNEIKFMNHVETTNELTIEQKKDIYLVLFLAIHESNMEGHFKSQYIPNFIDEIKDIDDFRFRFYWTIYNNIITDINNWTKDKLFNELLPENHIFIYNEKALHLDTLRNATEPYENEAMLKDILESYLKYILKLFINTWNNFFKEKKSISK